ncbi:YqhR family membrane protein [Cytobacillus sp. Hz8]|uniref:YqhR family membrane protein n=1 Tax=Cytobacillus sp. Hz8 TaxID=3347168 RepID=UPI0035DFA3D6
MMSKDETLEQNQREEPMSFIMMVIVTGLFGGIFWSGLAYFAYLFHFTEIRPNIVLEPWTVGNWKYGWLGTVISIIFIGVFSIVAALIYYVALRRFKSMWVGALYGIILFLLVFFVLNPLFPGMDPFSKLGKTTIITSLCFYILYGTFIGYSISFEENEIRNRKKQPSST